MKRIGSFIAGLLVGTMLFWRLRGLRPASLLS